MKVSLLRAMSGIGMALAAPATPCPAQDAPAQAPSPASAAPVRDIRPGDPVSARLDPDHGRPYDDYRLHLPPNGSVRIDMESPTPDSSATPQPDPNGFDTYLDLRSPDGRSLASNDDRGDGTLNSRLVFTAPSEGDYIIRARPLGGRISSSDNPTYMLRVTALAPAPDPLPLSTSPIEGHLAQDSPEMDFLGSTNHYAVYWFEGLAGDRVQARVTSDAPETILQIVDGAGATLAANTGDGPDVRVVTVLPAAGRYLVRVQAPVDQAARYTLALERVLARGRERTEAIRGGAGLQGVPLSLASSVSPKSDGSGQADFFYRLYSLPVVKDHPVTVLLAASGFPAVLDAGEVDTLGFVSWVSARSGPEGNARLVLQPFRTGTVFIRVRSAGLSLGSFNLQVAEGVSTSLQ